ncbi:MAG: leucine-rich repeat domain-containing protein, partial [Verrucomicrobiales bacterium]|nr:leucine-rich repeat domain-containing protein [Verrucomicrobiales bacterium]
MNATYRLRRWFGSAVALMSGLDSAVLLHGLMRGFLPLLMLCGATLAARGQYQFGTQVNPDGTLTVYRGAAEPSGALVIPGTIDGRTVAVIGERAFGDCPRLTEILIPPTVFKIRRWAFSNCIGLTEVTIPASVSVLERGAFTGCTGLSRMVIPDTVRSIDTDLLFSGCTRLESVRLPISLKVLGNGTFGGCISLRTFAIPGEVVAIRGAAFKGCSSLTHVYVPRGVTELGGYAFTGCASLAAIDVDPDNALFRSEDGVVFDKALTTLVAYPGGRKGGYVVREGIVRIGSDAFSDCDEVDAVTLPSTLRVIERSAFLGCGKLSDMTIPDGVTILGELAFYECTHLTNVTIGENVASMGNHAFSGCTNLVGVTMGGRVGSIGFGAFSYCTRLTSVTIPDGVTSIWASTFAFSGLTSVTVGKGVKNIGSSAFGNCASLRAAYFAGDAPPNTEADAFGDPRGEVSPTSVFYLPGTLGWGPTFAGRPTGFWVRSIPTILGFGERFGLSADGFGFVISWATNVPVVVEASMDVDGLGWTTISTNALE